MIEPRASWDAHRAAACERLRGALHPNRLIRLFVAGSDSQGRWFSVSDVAEILEHELMKLVGGHSSTAALGGYQPVQGPPMREETIVVESYLPEEITDAVRDGVIELALDFGVATGQEMVLVAVGVDAHRIPILAESEGV